MNDFSGGLQEGPAAGVDPGAIVHDQDAQGRQRVPWMQGEIAIVRAMYPHGGMEAVHRLLPNKSEKAIYQKAHELGLRAPNMPQAYRRWSTTVHIDEAIRRYYVGRPAYGGIERLGRQIGRPARWISHRARQLGIIPPRFAPPPWTPAEDELLRKLGSRVPASIAKAFARSGFRRTPGAIQARLRQRGIDRLDEDHYTGRALATLFGVGERVIYQWIDKGWLAAKTQGTTREHDIYRIHRAAVRRFIVENVGAIDIRRVEKHWFVDLVAGSP